MDKWTRVFFVTMFILHILYLSSNFTSQLSMYYLDGRYRLVTVFALFFESLFSSLLMPLLTIYIQHVSGTKHRGLFKFVYTLWGIFALTLTSTLFTKEIFYISADNVYHRGPYYNLLLIPPVVVMLTNFALFLIDRKKIPATRQKAIFLYILIPTIAMITQMFSYGIFAIALGSVVSSLVMFLLIIKEDSKIFNDQKSALIEQDYRTKTLQMRPHFIYNTLSNIYYLCEIDPMKAQTAIDDFSTYLKSNFGAISKENLIPFEEELQHTKAYVAVVKARYEDYLFVDFDTPFINFKLPPLTLEPLVENAVKHALDPNQGPLYVLVRTRRENSYNIIIVENSGKDFPLEDETEASSLAMNDEPHIGLSNVKRRLEISCGGSLKVSKRPDGGTIATIRIPADLSAF